MNFLSQKKVNPSTGIRKELDKLNFRLFLILFPTIALNIRGLLIFGSQEARFFSCAPVTAVS